MSQAQEQQMEQAGFTDLLIVGSGLAGLAAAVEAYQSPIFANKKITIIEKDSKIGGNSAKATSGINSVATPAQSEQSVQDSYAKFEQDTLVAGNNLGDPQLVKKMIEESTSAWYFLNRLGVALDTLSQCGGHSEPRTHRPAKAPTGWAIISALKKYIETVAGNSINVVTNSYITSLITHNEDSPKARKGVRQYIVGVTGQFAEGGEQTMLRIVTPAVIIATGGYAHDRTADSLLARYVPHIKDLPTTTSIHSQGDGIKMAVKIGAALVDMEHVQVHPTGLVDPKNPWETTKFLGPELLRGVGGILLDCRGNRFCNELGLRNYITEQIFTHCPKSPQSQAYLVLNLEAKEAFGPTLGFYQAKGFINLMGNGSLVAEDCQFPAENFRQTLLDYKKSAEAGQDQFGKTRFPTVFEWEQPFLVAKITPVLHYTMGGLKINRWAQVLNQAKEVIQGLYAAGEVTGGVHGNNRLVGNGLLDNIVFGREAGRQVSRYIKEQS